VAAPDADVAVTPSVPAQAQPVATRTATTEA
jgi:hypothetical protein